TAFGSTRAARLQGPSDATSAVAPASTAPAKSATLSHESTLSPELHHSSSLTAPPATTPPITTPSPDSHRLRRITRPTTPGGDAPKALRIPISLDRGFTRYDITPYMPDMLNPIATSPSTHPIQAAARNG